MFMLANIPGEVLPLVAIGGGISIPIIAILAGTISGVAKTRHLEQSRRELAAYVAEGTMTSDEAERLLKARPQSGCGPKRES